MATESEKTQAWLELKFAQLAGVPAFEKKVKIKVGKQDITDEAFDFIHSVLDDTVERSIRVAQDDLKRTYVKHARARIEADDYMEKFISDGQKLLDKFDDETWDEISK